MAGLSGKRYINRFGMPCAEDMQATIMLQIHGRQKGGRLIA
jgi:hypothetical protein